MFGNVCRCCGCKAVYRSSMSSVWWSTLLLLSIWSSQVDGQRLLTVPQNLTVLEGRPRGMVIGQISVSSAVPPFSVYHADRQDASTILVSGDGVVTVGDKVDRESKSLYRLIAHASNNINVEVLTVVLL